MPAPRGRVVGAFVLLIVIMIVTNLILLAVYAGWSIEEDQAKRLAEFRETGKWTHQFNSIRFVRHSDGRMFLFTPEVLAEEEIVVIAQRIEAVLTERGLLTKSVVQGVIRMEGRLRRALERSPLEIPTNDVDSVAMWDGISNWPLLESKIPLGQVLRFANKVKILQAMNSRRGTQLKIELLLDGGQMAIFKPKWYGKDVIVKGDIYGGKDRHFGEISAFYLSQLLGYNNAPITVGRRINLAQEILPYSTRQLKNTFSQNSSGLCFYGVCYYCKPEESVCADGETLDGALVLIMKPKIRLVPNPWRRTYKKNVFAPWETNKSFCQDLVIKEVAPREQQDMILDIVAVSIFDFLIGNGDRHHLEMYAETPAKHGHSKSILLIDNGKSFGNPLEDYIDILAPLFQCCKLRAPLWSTLKKFEGRLGKSLDAVMTFDPLYPLLNSMHLNALDQRLEMVFAAVHVCRQSHSDVIVH